METVQCFPIEENATIYSFIVKIDKHEIRAQLKERIQAQQEYSQVLQQGNGAYLMKQDEKSSDIFIINVGALLPEEECQIQISYVIELPRSHGKYIYLVVPTTISSQYNSTDDAIASPVDTQSSMVNPHRILSNRQDE